MKNNSFLVTTVSGNQIPRNKCRYISKEYYEINKDCFFMEDAKWHRINNGQIEFDHESETYVLIDRVKLISGIVAISKDGTIQHGYFSKNPLRNIVFNDSHCLSEEAIIGKRVVEQLSTGYFYTEGTKSESSLNKKGIGSRYSFQLDYSASSKLGSFTEIYNNIKKDAAKTVCPFTKELNDASFGFEFETDNGFIPERKIYSHGLIPLRDGSLRHDGLEPFEFTTIPLSGNDGINTLCNISEVLQKYTTISHRCALHVHIGGYKGSDKFVVALHRLMLRIQDEIYSMFPENYRFTSQDGFKQKDYCAPIKNIKILKSASVKDNFEKIFSFYCNGAENFKGFNVTPHPLDREERHKWNVDYRYFIVNMIPFIWGKSGTIEWRVHPPTQNKDKIINWLFITNGILKFVDKHKEKIADFEDLRDIDLAFIMQDIYSDDLSARLNNYISFRKHYMIGMDSKGLTELKNDLDKIPSNCSLLC